MTRGDGSGESASHNLQGQAMPLGEVGASCSAKRITKESGMSLAKDYESFSKILGARAETMRKAPTKTENVIRKRLGEMGADYKEQVPFGRYILDFLVRGRVVIEVDGASHKGQESYDAKRDKFCREMGLKVIRIPASKVNTFNLYRIVKKPKANTDLRVFNKREKLIKKREEKAEKIVSRAFDWAKAKDYEKELESGFNRAIS